MSRRTYATLSLLSRSEAALTAFGQAIAVLPTRTTERNGLHGKHYSTRDLVASDSLDAHLERLQRDLAQAPLALAAALSLHEAEVETTLWVFHDSSNENEAVAVPSRLVHWLAQMNGDICVDIWRST